MKKFKKLINLLLIIQLLVMLVACSPSLDTVENDLPEDTNAPVLPISASSVNEFIPPEWEVLEQSEFDFNNDGYADYVVVINSKHEKEYETEGYDGEIYPRTLFVVFSSGENNYELVYQNSGIIDVDMHGLTCCGYNIPTVECAEKSFVLTNFTGNNASSSYSTDVYYFTYDNEWQIAKHAKKYHRTAFIIEDDDDDVQVDEDGKLIIDTNVPSIAEIEKDFTTNIIKHRDMLTKDDNETEFAFEYEFFDEKNDGYGFGSEFLTQFENDTYKYFVFSDFEKLSDGGGVIPNISIKRLNKTNNKEEVVFAYYMEKKGENVSYHYSGNAKFDYTLGFVFLQGNEMIVRLEDGYDNVKKIYRVNLDDFTAEYIGLNWTYWL